MEGKIVFFSWDGIEENPGKKKRAQLTEVKEGYAESARYYLKRKEKLEMEVHEDVDQTTLVYFGTVLVTNGMTKEKRTVYPGNGFVIYRGTQHEIENISDTNDAILITVYSSAVHYK